jgi:GMP synthase-like glutamine amidotransferase
MADTERALYAILFHPEVVHTEHGLEITLKLRLRCVRLHRRLDDGVVC